MAQARAHNVPIAHVRAFQPGHRNTRGHPIMGPAEAGRPFSSLAPSNSSRTAPWHLLASHDDLAVGSAHRRGWLCGVAGLVVLKTVHAIDQDLEVTVLSDLCVDADQARHDACMDAVLPTLARVMPSDEWLATLGSGPDGSPQKTAAGALRGLL